MRTKKTILSAIIVLSTILLCFWFLESTLDPGSSDDPERKSVTRVAAPGPAQTGTRPPMSADRRDVPLGPAEIAEPESEQFELLLYFIEQTTGVQIEDRATWALHSVGRPRSQLTFTSQIDGTARVSVASSVDAWRIESLSEEWAPYTHTFSPRDGATVTVMVLRTRPLRIQVTDSAGVPIVGAIVSALGGLSPAKMRSVLHPIDDWMRQTGPSSVQERSSITDGEGIAELGRVADPTACILAVAKSGYIPARLRASYPGCESSESIMRTIVLAESEVAGSIELAIDPPEELREWTLYAHFEEEKRLPHAPDQLLIGASLGREPVVVPLLASSATQWLVATQLGGASAMITQQVVGNEAFGGMMTIRLPRLWPCSVKLTDNLRAGRIVAILAYCHAEPFFPGSGTELYAKQEYSSEVVTLLSDPILLPEGFRAQITAILDDGIALDHTFNMPSAPATVELNQPTTEDSPSTLHILSSIALDAPIRVYSRGPYMEVKPRRVSGSWELLIPRDAQRLLIPLEGGLRVQLRKQRDFNGQLPAVDLRYLEAQECVIRLHDSHGNRIAGLACSVFPDRLEGTQAALFGESRMVAGGVFEATVNKGVPLRSDHMGVARCLLPTGTYRLNVKLEYTGMFSSPPLSVLSPTEGNFSVVFGSQEFAFTIESARMVSIVLVGDRISDTARWVVRWIPDARRELGYGRDLTFRAGEGPANLRIELEDGSVVSDVTLPAGKESLLLEIRVP